MAVGRVMTVYIRSLGIGFVEDVEIASQRLEFYVCLFLLFNLLLLSSSLS